MSKKTWVFIIVAAAIGLLAFIIYFFFFRADVREARRIAERPELTSPFGDGLPSDGFDRRDDFDFQFPMDSESRIRQITSVPVSGFNIFTVISDDETDATEEGGELQNIIKFVERATGHIFEATYDSIDNTRFSNVTIPKNYYSLILDEGSKVIYRLLDEENEDVIRTYFAEFNREELEGGDSDDSIGDDSEVIFEVESSGTFFVDNITHLIKSPAEKLFGLITNKSDLGFNSVGFLINQNDLSDIEVVLNSQISEWVPQWVTENTIALTSRSTYKVDGYTFILNTDTGAMTRIMGPIKGLNTLFSPNGEYALISSSTENATDSFIYDVTNKTTQRAFARTLAEKCTWSSESVYIVCAVPQEIPAGIPDTWYQGRTSFRDVLVVYSMESGRIAILNEYGNQNIPPLDIINLKISDDNTLLVFQNKRDLSLWAYDLRD